jgi:hypothetical protein
MNRQNSLAVLLCAVALAACNYDKNAVQDITAPDPGSRIRFFNFGVNAPAVNFYANDAKVTAVGSTSGTEATTGTAYGGVGLAGLYSALAPGQYAFTGRIAATVDKDRPISTVTTTIAAGKYYSFYMSGFYDATAKTVEGFVTEDPFVPPTDFTVATVRFVHAISNANPLTLFGKSGTAAEIAIGGEVGYKFAGAFTTIPAGVYDLTARYGAAATTALTRPAVTFVGGRVYTITARGDITVAPSTACAAANRTCLDNTTNR